MFLKRVACISYRLIHKRFFIHLAQGLYWIPTKEISNALEHKNVTAVLIKCTRGFNIELRELGQVRKCLPCAL